MMLSSPPPITGTILHLVIPDLFAHHTVVDPQLSLDTLSLLLSRAAVSEGWCTDNLSILFTLFGLAPEKPLPIAPLTHLCDTQDGADKIWMRADPVHLRADQSHLLLFDAASAFSITSTEANALVGELNAFFRPEGLTFSAPVPTRWYVALPEMPALTTYPLPEVVGCDLHPYMPEGNDKRLWRKYLTEAQMILHQSIVNEQRELRGELPINSVWFWGLGRLPAAPAPRWKQIWSNDPVVKGLAALTHSPCKPLPEQANDLNFVIGEQLITLTVEGLVDWNQWLAQVDKYWLFPLWQALKRQQLHQLVIHPCDSRAMTITSSSVKYWWRRRRSWQSFSVVK